MKTGLLGQSVLLIGLMSLSTILTSCENLSSFKETKDVTDEPEDTCIGCIDHEEEIDKESSDAEGVVTLSVDRLNQGGSALLQVEIYKQCESFELPEQEYDDIPTEEMPSPEEPPTPEQKPTLELRKKSEHRPHKNQKNDESYHSHSESNFCGLQFLKVYELEYSSDQIKIEGLLVGESFVTVSLLDAYGQIVQSGSAGAYIVAGQITPVTIQLSSRGGILVDIIPEEEVKEMPDMEEFEKFSFKGFDYQGISQLATYQCGTTTLPNAIPPADIHVEFSKKCTNAGHTATYGCIEKDQPVYLCSEKI